MTSAVVTNRKRRPTPVGAFRAKQAARFCSIGASTWSRMDAAGLIPAGSFVSGCKLWGKRELAKWIDHGCPPRTEWAAIWSQHKNRIS